MPTCTVASRVSAESTGWIIGFRVWDLRAYDRNNNCVACVNQDMGDNRVKFRAFIEAVAKAGYCLTPDQVRYIQSELLLDLPQFDNKLARYATIQVVRSAANNAVDGLTGIPYGSAIAGQVLGVSPADAAEQLCHTLGI
jgi:hypothetical protein